MGCSLRGAGVVGGYMDTDWSATDGLERAHRSVERATNTCRADGGCGAAAGG
jgi:hypothetical protein